jgi:hypothetical protein
LATELLEKQVTLKSDAVMVAINQKFGFLRGVSQNIIAGVVTSVITFGLIFSAWMYSEGPDKILARAANKFIQPEPASAQTPAQPATPIAPAK